ncbi:TLC domain-containing protein [Pavlovales sp. CCMP2436]|nr:TLC domain-containing protein [Pavlovales sp. CCMP2436]|mmetsp:Transcript_50355/g.118081  ORF Transcript_50355/g.118081 Transcript_50355/m.118081 type:complete len:350 (-) Transcript_50355:87-1136(-)
MWEKAAHQRARQLFLALTTAYTLITGYAFVRTTADAGLRARTGGDWVRCVLLFTPVFIAMHLAAHGLHAMVLGARQSAKKQSAPWFASHVVSMAHALVVTVAALSNLVLLWDAPAAGKLGTRTPPVGAPWVGAYPLIAAVGELFTAWLLYDLFVVCAQWSYLGSLETLAHHVAFLAAAGVLRGYYFAPWQATACLCMEASTPFLNICQLKEALGLSKRSPLVIGSFGCFALNFLVFRILLLGSALTHLIFHWNEGPWLETPPSRAVPADELLPPVPSWAAYALLILLVAAFVMMISWFNRIIAILAGPAAGGAEQLPSDESDAAPDTPRVARRTRHELSDEEELALVNV